MSDAGTTSMSTDDGARQGGPAAANGHHVPGDGRPGHDHGGTSWSDDTGPRLRIAMVAPPLLPVPPTGYAGTERVVAALADGLVARGHHVTLFASGDSTAGTDVMPVVPQAVWLGGYRSEVAPYQTLSAAAAWAHAQEFDLLHVHLETIGLPLARHAGVPVVTTFHQRLDLPGTYDCLAAFPDVPVVAISESQRRWHPDVDWVATIPHGLPLASMPFGQDPGDYLALVGRVSPEKGIEESIELATSTGHRLRIAAKAIEPAEVAMVEAVIRPVADRGVEFLGELGERDRDPLLAGATATLMLGAWPEPFGLVAIESLATGTPVIARRAGALPEIIEHGIDGFLVDDLDEARLALRLVRDLDRAEIRRRAIKRFGVERMVADYAAVYRTVMHRSASQSTTRAADQAGPGSLAPSAMAGNSHANGRSGPVPVPASP